MKKELQPEETFPMLNSDTFLLVKLKGTQGHIFFGCSYIQPNPKN